MKDSGKLKKSNTETTITDSNSGKRQWKKRHEELNTQRFSTNQTPSDSPPPYAPSAQNNAPYPPTSQIAQPVSATTPASATFSKSPSSPTAKTSMSVSSPSISSIGNNSTPSTSVASPVVRPGSIQERMKAFASQNSSNSAPTSPSPTPASSSHHSNTEGTTDGNPPNSILLNYSKTNSSSITNSPAPKRPSSIPPTSTPQKEGLDSPLSPRHSMSGLPTNPSSSPLGSPLSPRSELISRPQRLKKEKGTHIRQVSALNLSTLPEKSGKPVAELDERRALIVGELLSTEESYVKSLTSLVTKYVKPIRDFSAQNPKLVPVDFCKKVFANVEDILPLNELFCEGLRGKVSSWTNKTELGDILTKFLPFLKLYSTYSNNYEDSIATIAQVTTSDGAGGNSGNSTDGTSGQASPGGWWAQFCPNKLEFEALLITPIQRIPRYVMLLEDLYKHTPNSHPDNKSLELAIGTCREVASHVNSVITITKNFEHLTFLGLGHLLEPHRKLVLEGEMTITHVRVYDSSKQQKKMKKNLFFLFNDLFVFMKIRKEFKETTSKGASLKKGIKIKRVWDNTTDTAWPLELVWLRSVDEKSFEVIGPMKTLTVQTKEKSKWYETIKTQIQELLSEGNPNIPPGAAETLQKRKGRYTQPTSGEIYEGDWDLGRMHGKGISEFLGTVYEGDYELNIKKGVGKLEYSDGQVYHGEFRSGKPHGTGTSVTVTGDKYTGSWAYGKRQGQGELIWANGASYVGEWKDNHMHGNGEFKFLKLGVTYSGSFCDGKYHGSGSLTNSEGIYAGSFDVGRQTGDGTTVYVNGDTYEGQWRNGLRHGNGTLKTKYYTFSGSWVRDVKQGKGIVHYTDGSVYEGSFVDGMRHGKGVYTSPTGYVKSYSGEWFCDAREGSGEITFSTGDRYEGPIAYGQPHGTGRMLLTNGMIFEGKWNWGILEGKLSMVMSSALITGTLFPTAAGNEGNAVVAAVQIGLQEDGQVIGQIEGVEMLAPPFLPVLQYY